MEKAKSLEIVMYEVLHNGRKDQPMLASGQLLGYMPEIEHDPVPYKFMFQGSDRILFGLTGRENVYGLYSSLSTLFGQKAEFMVHAVERPSGIEFYIGDVYLAGRKVASFDVPKPKI